MKIFKFMVLRLLENKFVSRNIESIHFYLCPKQDSPSGSYHHPQDRSKLTISSMQCFLEKLFFPTEKWKGRGRNYEKAKKLT